LSKTELPLINITHKTRLDKILHADIIKQILLKMFINQLKLCKKASRTTRLVLFKQLVDSLFQLLLLSATISFHTMEEFLMTGIAQYGGME